MAGTYLFGWDSVNKVWVKLVCDANGKLKIDPTLILENPPTENLATKAALSEWSYDHWKDASAHHVKFTALEAQTACKLNGTLYWSCAGIHFDAMSPDVDDVTKNDTGTLTINVNTVNVGCAVNLLNGVTVKACIIYGNDGSEAEGWGLYRVLFSTGVRSSMGGALINVEDITISRAVIDNSLYGYYLYIEALDSGDIIYGARIKYTL